eukprot:197524-Pyramimonas_sp.AAC.1
MPNGSAGASLLSSTLPNSEMKVPIEANAALRRLRGASATIAIESMPSRRLLLVALCDSGLGFAGAGQDRPRMGGAICAAEKHLL